MTGPELHAIWKVITDSGPVLGVLIVYAIFRIVTDSRLTEIANSVASTSATLTALTRDVAEIKQGIPTCQRERRDEEKALHHKIDELARDVNRTAGRLNGK